MNDPYRLSGPQADPGTPDRNGIGARRALLWTVLVVSAAGNAVTSMSGLPVAVSVSCGVVTILCIAGLLADRSRRRRA
ncbi:hypothetical protein [Actinoallomurus soli]|uniref:hypothetical protein n=1 Tax=Actinoallomurus soli TaxID=2952535 RepID=UPI002093B09B|nr:hypothetical protein [Actinoallomurus soli]MCO5967578.1 hypothetical protein [Actinoallomurus soli]